MGAEYSITNTDAETNKERSKPLHFNDRGQFGTFFIDGTIYFINIIVEVARAMLFEIGSSVVMLGVAGWAYLKQNGPAMNDAEKIQRIFANAGLTVRENGKMKTIRLQRKRRIQGGTEYVYQLPLGMSSKQVMEHKHIIEDGLNVRHKIFKFDPRDLLKIKWDRTALKQIKEILTSKKIARKEIDIDFDGMLKIRVYNEPLPKEISWKDDFIKYGGWFIPVGQSRTEFVYHDFEDRPHMIVAGATGFGKSQFLKMVITSLIMIQAENVRFTLIDLKGGTAFQRFKDLKQVKYYGRNPQEAREILKAVQEEMNATLNKIVDAGFEDVKEAGIKERHFVIIDEAADISKDAVCMDIVTDIARRGRGAGYRLIYATQYPTNETLPSQVRQNVGARVCFVLETNAASRAVLDEGGAEELPEIAGRAIYRRVKNTIVQTPYMDNKTIKEKIGPHIIIKTRGGGDHEQKSGETTTNRKYSLNIEKI